MNNSHTRSHLITFFAIVILFVSISGVTSARVSSFWRLVNQYAYGEAWLCETGFRIFIGRELSNPAPAAEEIFIFLHPENPSEPELLLSIFSIVWIPLNETPIDLNQGREVGYSYLIDYEFPAGLPPFQDISVKGLSPIWNSREHEYSATCPPEINNDAPGEPLVIDYEAHMRDRDPNGESRVLVELGAPVAAYCESGNFNVYNLDVNTGDGSLAVSVSVSTLATRVAEAQASGGNILVSEGARSTQVWALSSGEIQVNAYDLRDTSKLYEHIFSANVCG